MKPCYNPFPMSSPITIKKKLENYSLVNKVTGRLGDSICRFEDGRKNILYLKYGSGAARVSLQQETVVLEKLEGSRLRVPKKVHQEINNGQFYLLMTGLSGVPANKLRDRSKEDILRLASAAMNEFHSVVLSDMDDLYSLQKQLDIIHYNIRMGFIKNDDFKKSNNGKDPQSIYEYLKNNMESMCRDVLIHGDYCLPNILVNGADYGFIDLGECGLGDPHKDYSTLEVSIKRNFGEKYIQVFYEHMDSRVQPDSNKIAYFKLIDQFGYHLDIEKFKALG